MTDVLEQSTINGIGDDTARARTGKAWAEWFEVLDAAGGEAMDHKAIVAYLAQHYAAVGGWWIQGITVAYEQSRGKRAKHEKPGGYEVSGSKTVGVPIETLYAAWTDEDVRGRWLPGAAIVIRKATPSRSLRITWPDGTDVNVMFWPKGDGKSQVTLGHAKLADAAAAASAKAYWKERLAWLKTVLEA